MLLRSEELRRNIEIEWGYVRSCLRDASPETAGLAFDDQAWDLWFPLRGALPPEWHEEWLPLCVEHGARYVPSESERRSVAVGRLEMAAMRELGHMDEDDLRVLRAELYRIADLALDILGVAE